MNLKERKSAHDHWLKYYTWIQLDGSVNYSYPRVRPKGLPIHEKEKYEYRHKKEDFHHGDGGAHESHEKID